MTLVEYASFLMDLCGTASDVYNFQVGR
jgi:hypothetical protein